MSYSYNALVSSPEDPQLNYRRLVGAAVTELGSCDKHPVFGQDWNIDVLVYIDRKVMANFKPGENVRKMFYQSVTWVACKRHSKYSQNRQKGELNQPEMSGTNTTFVKAN